MTGKYHISGRKKFSFSVAIGRVFLCVFLVSAWLSGFSQNTSKTGGIAFRIDDNPSLSQLNSLDSLFRLHQRTFSLAITPWSLPLSPDYVDRLKEFSAYGHEIMDNTPTHNTHYFSLLNIQDTSLFVNEWGVDHFNGQQVCLKYTSIDLSTPHGEGPLNIAGNQVISANPGEFSDLNGNPYFFAIYIQFMDKPYLWYDLKNKNPNDPDSLRVKSFWGEPVDLGTHWWFNYKKLTQRDVYMHPSAITLLGRWSQTLFSNLGIDVPATWVHPAGQMPWLNAFEVKSNLGDSLGYSAGTNFANAAYFCYNEANPGMMKQFALQSGDISIENQYFSWNKPKIADAFAKHFVKVDLSYLQDPLGGWNAYLQRVDSLLTWCSANQIPVKTIGNWSGLVFDSLPNRGVNIFPKLNADLDGDGFPDGYDQDTVNLRGVFNPADGVAASGGKCFEIDTTGSVCRISMLGGIEKGNNKFSIWLKRTGTDSTDVNVEMLFPETGTSQTLVFPVDSNQWGHQFQVVSVPENASLVNILIKSVGQHSDTIRISGMDIRSSGFLTETEYPDQVVEATTQFVNVDLNQLVNDSVYSPAEVTWSVRPADTMNLKVLTGNILQILKPASFWSGKDSTYVVAMGPEGLSDSCFMRFISNPLEVGCSGVPITLTLLDTLSNDVIRWSSVPFDSTFTDTTIYNPTVAPLVTTLYKVVCINPLGNINRDSILLTRFPFPDPHLPADTAICKGDSVKLTAAEGVRFLWSTGDTTASITVSPLENTIYSVVVENEYECSMADSTLVTVADKPVVNIWGLRTAYCVNDWSTTVVGSPPGGVLGATSGLIGNQFYPDKAMIGVNKVWYTYISETGCGNSDTITVNVYDLPRIQPLPDSTLCAGKSIILHAGPGFDNYQWSTGSTDSLVSVDTTGHGAGLLPVWVYVTKNGCASKDTALITFVVCPGMDDNPLANRYLIYPNPVSSGITIRVRSGESDRIEVKVIGSTGVIRKQTGFEGVSHEMELKDLIPGVYVMRITRGDQFIDYKFIKL